jgi:hypothetical protein
MHLTRSRVTCQSMGTCRPVLLLSAICSLLLLAGCGAPGASVPGPSATAASHRLSSATCPAARAAMARPSAPLPTAPTGAHLSYSLLALGPLPPQLVYHPGATVRFTWCALPDLDQVSAQPVSETLTAGFIGPFSTRAAVTADRLPPSPPPSLSSRPPNRFPPPGPIVASTTPIHTTTWSGADDSALLTLPTTLAPGYYIFFAQDDVSVQACAAVTAGGTAGGCRGNSGVSGIVQISPA